MPITNAPPTDVSGVNRATPAAAYGAGAGTTPPGTPTVAGDDARGSVTFGSGSTPAAGTVITVTFVQPRDATRPPVISLQEAIAAACGIDWGVTFNTSGSQITGFNIITNTRNVTASQANGTYAIGWILAE